MNLNEKLKNYLTHEENDFLKVENSYNKKTSYLVGFEFASGSLFLIYLFFSLFFLLCILIKILYVYDTTICEE